MKDAVLQLSGIVADLVYRVPHPPRPGEDVLAESFALHAGGGFNAIAAARREGARAAYAGRLGAGPFAEAARQALAAEGAPALLPPLAREQGTCVVMVDAAGERAFVSVEGAEAALSDALLAGVDGAAWGAAIVSGYPLMHPESRGPLARWIAAQGPGLRLLLDPTSAHAAIPAEILALALSRAAWISANAAEAAGLLGRPGTPAPEEGPALAAALLARLGPGAEGALVRLGPAGCALATPAGAVGVAGFPVRAVDANGAGDAHLGAFAAGLIAGLPPVAAARRANAVAALAVTREGPAAAPARAETDALLAAHGFGPDGRPR